MRVVGEHSVFIRRKLLIVEFYELTRLSYLRLASIDQVLLRHGCS